MGISTQYNVQAQNDNWFYDELLPAVVKDFLTQYLSSPAKINDFADDPTLGFLNPAKRSQDPSTLTADDYYGLISSDQYSQIGSKINGMYTGTGTEAAKAVKKALIKHGGLDLALLSEDMLNRPQLYFPVATAGNTTAWPDNGSTSVTGQDFHIAANLMKVCKLYRYAAGSPKAQNVLGSPAAQRGYILLVGGKDPVPAKAGDLAACAMDWAPDTQLWGDFATSKEATPYMLKNNKLAKGYQKDENLLFRQAFVGTAWANRGTNQFFRDFTARIARNHPDRIKLLTDEIIDGIIADLKSDEAVAKGLNAATGIDKDVGNRAFKPKPKVSKEELSKYRGFLKPFDLQCFLLENINFISSTKDNAKPYKHVGRIENSETGGQPGNLVSYINHGFRDEQAEVLLEMCPDVYALLLPYIRIYRVDYSIQDKLVPYRETEIPFPAFQSPSDIQDIMDGDAGRIPGAGIKSFSWSLEGTQPEAVENNITAQLVLHFQTIQDLFSLNKDANGVYRAGITNNNHTFDQADDVAQPGYLDLIIGSGTSFTDEKIKPSDKPPKNATVCDIATEGYEGESFRIKVVVGWAAPPNLGTYSMPGFMDQMPSGKTKGDVLREALERTKTSLYLQVTRHQLNFNDNGSVDMTIDYQAALSGILKAPNADIFGGKSRYEAKLKNLDHRIETARKARKKKAIKAHKEDNDEGQDTSKEQELLEEKAKLKTQDRMIRYKKFLSSLYKSDKIYSIKVDRQAYQTGLLSGLTSKERAEKAKVRIEGNQDHRGFGNPQQASDFDTSLLETLAKFQSTKGNTPENAEERNKEFEQFAALALKEADDGSVTVPYFYLGDLVDEILEDLSHLTVDKKGKNGSFQLLLGAMEMVDPLVAFQVKSLEIDCGDAKTQNIIKAINEVNPLRFVGKASDIMFSLNLGSVPISLNYFQEWFINKVIKPQRDNYMLLRFIKDVCSQLIGKAFNSMCFENDDNPVLRYNLRFDTSTFTLANSYAGKDTPVKNLAVSKAAADIKAVEALRPDQKALIPTMIIYSVDSKPKTGNYDDDLAHGIYHYYLGSACGLAKNIKFSRIDMPYFREARLSKMGALGAEQLRELYSVSLDMVGNTLHKNGQYIYIEPIGVGLGSVKSTGTIPNLARLLGIGGYHLVTGVKSTISDAGFNVQVSALQEGMSFGENKIVSVKTHAGGALIRGDWDKKVNQDPDGPTEKEFQMMRAAATTPKKAE